MMLYQHTPYNQALPYDAYHQIPPSFSQRGWNAPQSMYKQPRRRREAGCCLGVLLALVALIAAGTFLFLDFLSHPPAFFLPDVLNAILLIPGIIVTGGILFFAAVSRRFRRWLLKGGFVFMIVVIMSAIAGSTIFWAYYIAPNVGMTRTAFLRTSVNTGSRETIRFQNPSDGVTQILCVGVDQHCRAGYDDPAQLDQGLIIRPGQIVSVVFDTDGDYQITSKTTAHMNITIHVDDSD